MLFDIGITVVCLGIEYLQIGFVKFSGTLSNFLVEHSMGFLGSTVEREVYCRLIN